MSFLRKRRRRFLLFSCMPWLRPLLLRRTLPDPLTRKRLAAARFVFILGMTCSDLAPGGRARFRCAVTEPRRCGARVMAIRASSVKPGSQELVPDAALVGASKERRDRAPLGVVNHRADLDRVGAHDEAADHELAHG